MRQEQRSLLIRGMGAFAAVLVVLLAVGTFYDYQIAQAVYAPDNPLVIFVSTLGLALVISIIFALVVMSCRMVLGAHFLSDVSVGALLSVVAFLVLMALQKPAQQEENSLNTSDSTEFSHPAW